MVQITQGDLQVQVSPRKETHYKHDHVVIVRDKIDEPKGNLIGVFLDRNGNPVCAITGTWNNEGTCIFYSLDTCDGHQEYCE